MATIFNPLNPFGLSTPSTYFIGPQANTQLPQYTPAPLAPQSVNIGQLQSDLNTGKVKLQSITPSSPVVISQPKTSTSVTTQKISFSAPAQSTFTPTSSQKISFSAPVPTVTPTTIQKINITSSAAQPTSSQGRGPGEYYNPFTKQGMSSLIDPGAGFIKQDSGLNKYISPSFTTTPIKTQPTQMVTTQKPLFGIDTKLPTTPPLVVSTQKTSGLVSPELSASVQSMIAEKTLAPTFKNLDQKTMIAPGPTPEQTKQAITFLTAREGAKGSEEYNNIVAAYGKGLDIVQPKLTGDPKLDYKGDPFTNPYLTEKERDQIQAGNKPDWYKAQETRWQGGPGPAIQWATISAAGLNQANTQVTSLVSMKDEYDKTNVIPKLDTYNKTAAELKAAADQINFKYADVTTYENGKKVLPANLYEEYQNDVKNARIDEKLNTLNTLKPELDRALEKSTTYQKQIDTAYGTAKGKYDFAVSMSTAAQTAISDQQKEIDQYRNLISKASPATIAYVQKYGIETPEQLSARLGVESDKVKAESFNISLRDYQKLMSGEGTPDMPGYKELVTEAPTTANEIKRFQAITGEAQPFKTKDIIPFGIGDFLFPTKPVAPGETLPKQELSAFDKLVLATPAAPLVLLGKPEAELLTSAQTTGFRETVEKPLAPITISIMNAPGEAFQFAGRYVSGMETGSITIDNQVRQALFATELRDSLVAQRDAPNTGLFGIKSTPESRIDRFTSVGGNTKWDFSKMRPAQLKIVNDIKQLVLSGKENEVDTKYAMINVPKAQARELEYKVTSQAAGDITALGVGLATGVGISTLPKLATTIYAGSTLLTTPDPTQSIKAARDAIALGAIMKGASSILERGSVKLAGPRVETEVGGYRTLATAVPDNYKLKSGEMFVDLTKQPLSGGAIEGLASAKGASVANVAIGTKIPIGAPATELGFAASTIYKPISPFWAGVERVGGAVQKYGFPAAYGTYIAGQELSLAETAKTQGVQAYESERQKFLSEMGAFNLAMPIGTAAAQKTLANYDLKTSLLKAGEAAPTKPGEPVYVNVETKATTLGPTTITKFQKSPGEYLPKDWFTFMAKDLVFNKQLAQAKPGDIPFEKALSAFAKDPVAQEYTIELARKYGLNLYGNVGGKSYGGNLDPSQRSISDLDFAATADIKSLRSEKGTQQAFLQEWSQGMRRLGYNVNTTAEAVPKGKADIFVNTTSGEVTYRGEHAMSVHPYSESTKGLVEKYASWSDTLRGFFQPNPEGIKVIGAKEQLIRKLDLRPKDIFDIITYYGPEYSKIAGVSSKFNTLSNPLETITPAKATATRADILATAKPGQAVFFGVDTFVPPTIPTPPTPPKQVLPIIQRFNEIGKQLRTESFNVSETNLTQAEKALQLKLSTMKPGELALYKLSPQENSLMQSALQKQAVAEAVSYPKKLSEATISKPTQVYENPATKLTAEEQALQTKLKSLNPSDLAEYKPSIREQALIDSALKKQSLGELLSGPKTSDLSVQVATRLTPQEIALQNKLKSMSPSDLGLYKPTAEESRLMESALQKTALKDILSPEAYPTAARQVSTGLQLTPQEIALQNKLKSMDPIDLGLYKPTAEESRLMESALQKTALRDVLVPEAYPTTGIKQVPAGLQLTPQELALQNKLKSMKPIDIGLYKPTAEESRLMESALQKTALKDILTQGSYPTIEGKKIPLGLQLTPQELALQNKLKSMKPIDIGLYKPTAEESRLMESALKKMNAQTLLTIENYPKTSEIISGIGPELGYASVANRQEITALKTKLSEMAPGDLARYKLTAEEAKIMKSGLAQQLIQDVTGKPAMNKVDAALAELKIEKVDFLKRADVWKEIKKDPLKYIAQFVEGEGISPLKGKVEAFTGTVSVDRTASPQYQKEIEIHELAHQVLPKGTKINADMILNDFKAKSIEALGDKGGIKFFDSQVQNVLKVYSGKKMPEELLARFAQNFPEEIVVPTTESGKLLSNSVSNFLINRGAMRQELGLKFPQLDVGGSQLNVGTVRVTDYPKTLINYSLLHPNLSAQAEKLLTSQELTVQNKLKAMTIKELEAYRPTTEEAKLIESATKKVVPSDILQFNVGTTRPTIGSQQLSILQAELGYPTPTLTTGLKFPTVESLLKPITEKTTTIKDFPAVKKVSAEVEKLTADKFAKLEGQLSLADQGYGPGSANQIVKSIQPLQYVTNAVDADKLKNLISSSGASFDVRQNKLMQVYDVEGKLLQLEQPITRSAFSVDIVRTAAGPVTRITPESLNITTTPTRVPSVSPYVPADWAAQYPQTDFGKGLIIGVDQTKSPREKLTEEEKLKEPVSIYRQAERVTPYLDQLANDYFRGADLTTPQTTDYPSRVMPVSYSPLYPAEPYVPPKIPEVPYIEPYTPPAPYIPPYVPPTPYTPPPYDYTGYGYTPYKPTDYGYSPYQPGYTPYAPPYSPGYNPFGGRYSPPQIGGPGRPAGKGEGKTRKKKGLIQIKSSLFRKFAFGEKDLLINPEDIQAFKNIIGEKGTFFGYDVVPTREQIKREKERIAVNPETRKVLKGENSNIFNIKV